MYATRQPHAFRLAAISLGVAGALGSPLAMAQDEFSLEEVLVTARKISESVQEVPVAVTALSSSLISDLQINDLSDIAKFTPGLIFDDEFSRVSNRPVIRVARPIFSVLPGCPTLLTACTSAARWVATTSTKSSGLK